MLLTRRQTQIGIEITPAQIRATRVTLTRKGLRLDDAVILPIQSTLVDTLKLVRKRLARRKEKVITAISDDQVVCKTITLAAKLNHHELSAYIKSQALKIFGLSIDEIDFDYQPLLQQEQHVWQIVAAKKIILQRLIESCYLAELNLQAIDVNTIALTRLFRFIHTVTNEKIAIVITNPLHLQFCVVDNDQLIYSWGTQLPADDTPHFRQNLSAIIKQALQYFQQTVVQHTVHSIYLAGADEFLHDIAEHLQKIVNTKICVATLLPQCFDMRITFDGRLFVSLALALWGFVP